MPRIKQTAHRAAPSQSEIEEEDDFMADSEEENQPEEASGSRPKRRRRTPAQIAMDKRLTWENSFAGRKFRNERQVDAKALPEGHIGLRYIQQRGLDFWTEKLLGYNKNTVIEFYKFMVIPEGDWENNPAVGIASRVGGVDIVITPNDIARYLNIQRPPPESVNYPRKDEMVDLQVVNEILYSDPSLASLPHVPGNFKGSFRFLNKVIHYNLYPRGSESRPARKEGEILFAFAASELVVDWAMFIFTQLRDFKANTLITASMPFPCMITVLCKEKGVRGAAYEKLEELSPGTIDDTFDVKSSSQIFTAKGKQAKRGDYLTTMPARKDKQGSWIKKLFCQGVSIINSQRKEKVERRKIMREQERQGKELAWQTTVLEERFGVKYEPEPVDEGEVSDDFAGYESEELVD